MSASLCVNRRASIIAKLLACAPADDAVGFDPAFVRAKAARIVTAELLSAQLASVDPAVLGSIFQIGLTGFKQLSTGIPFF